MLVWSFVLFSVFLQDCFAFCVGFVGQLVSFIYYAPSLPRVLCLCIRPLPIHH